MATEPKPERKCQMNNEHIAVGRSKWCAICKKIRKYQKDREWQKKHPIIKKTKPNGKNVQKQDPSGDDEINAGSQDESGAKAAF